jgi:hypothetical protein
MVGSRWTDNAPPFSKVPPSTRTVYANPLDPPMAGIIPHGISDEDGQSTFQSWTTAGTRFTLRNLTKAIRN